MSKGKFVLGALVGAAAGVVAGMLTAPKSGKETRADIKSKAAELKGEAAKRVEDVKDISSKAVHDLKDRAAEFKDRNDGTVDEIVGDVKRNINSKK
jgi:gas vesicle protein